MMKKSLGLLVLCGVVALSACGLRPMQTTAADSASLDWVFTSAGNSGGYVTTKFFSGLLDVYDLRLILSGGNLRVNAPSYCAPEHERIRCTVPKLPAGKNFMLPVSGSNISAVALYKRSSSGPDLVRRIGAN